MWIMVMFDLPVDTKQARRQYTLFRKGLLKDGFTRMQFSVYVRHCASEENADVHDLKVTVFGGPVFRPSDRPYRGRQIPEDFWKVVAMLRADTQQLSATAYMLTQVDFLDDLEFTFGAYQTYQVPVAHIENLTGLDFGALKDHDPLAAIEAARPFLVLDRLERITF